MKNSKSIFNLIEDLKKNVANQLAHDAVGQEDSDAVKNASLVPLDPEEHLILPKEEGSVLDRVHHAPYGDLKGIEGQGKAPVVGVKEQGSGDVIDAKKTIREGVRDLSMVGTHMVVCTAVSYAIAWGLGHLFTLSSFWRIIMGALLAFAVNGLTVYRMIKQ